VKRRLVSALQNRLINPPIRFLLSRGFVPRSYALLETIGRRSGVPRRTPVGNGLDGDTFWIVAEHGHSAGYVRNIRANPRVRLKLWAGPLRSRWRSGTARVLEDDDPLARQKLISADSFGRRINAATVRLMGTDLVTVRVDLDDATGARRAPDTRT
jgi:deazaflavin-dependent oxidoreductase (nitroreductase family)